MDAYEGSARLEWWANQSTCLASATIHLVIRADETAWDASGSFDPPLSEDEREEWQMLLSSPWVTLVLPGRGDMRIDAHAELTDDQLRLTADQPAE